MTEEKIKIELTQDKLLDVLMHSATREDIAGLRAEIRQPQQTPAWLPILLTALLMLAAWTVYQTSDNQNELTKANAEIKAISIQVSEISKKLDKLLEK